MADATRAAADLFQLDALNWGNHVDHNNCRLGKWYNEGDGRAKFGTAASFGKVEAPHAEVHKAKRQVFALLGDVEGNYDAIIEALQKMERGSDEIFRLLDVVLAEREA